MVFFSLNKADNKENMDYLINENSINKEKLLLDKSNILQSDSYQFKTLNGESVYMIIFNFYYNIKKKFTTRIVNFLNKHELNFPLKIILGRVGEYTLRDLSEDLSDIDEIEIIQLSNIACNEVSVDLTIIGPLLKLRNIKLEHKVVVIWSCLKRQQQL
jgi:hypothetical protein